MIFLKINTAPNFCSKKRCISKLFRNDHKRKFRKCFKFGLKNIFFDFFGGWELCKHVADSEEVIVRKPLKFWRCKTRSSSLLQHPSTNIFVQAVQSLRFVTTFRTLFSNKKFGFQLKSMSSNQLGIFEILVGIYF